MCHVSYVMQGLTAAQQQQQQQQLQQMANMGYMTDANGQMALMQQQVQQQVRDTYLHCI